ncbi:MAG TPA: methyl-accepting chemotaxis protein [Myxococcales bacterium]|nr:methyl-accepting chemotaxis protein [Myxococcales bacterium]
MLPAVPPVVYLLGILYQLDDQQVLSLSLVWIPPLVVALGMVAPLSFIHRFTERALRESPEEQPGARLRRILSLPRQVELAAIASYSTGVAILTVAACRTYGRPLILLVPAVLVALVMMLLMMVRQTVKVEEVLRPVAVEEFERHPGVRPVGAGFLWPRQVWYLPYVTSVVLLASFVALAVIISRRVQAFLGDWVVQLEQRGQAQLAAEVPLWGRQLLSSFALPSILILGWVLVLSAITALTVARRQRAGSQAVEQAVRALAAGMPRLPEWPATDELGDLAFATADAAASLGQRAATITESARTVDQVAQELSALVARQRDLVTFQSSALQQTQLTAQEIQQISELASTKARAVLDAAESAERVGKSGRNAVESSLEQLSDIRGHVSQMAGHVRGLQERARRIARITLVVKDLADQSNMVALNAAIEATRAGESGKTFAVVAQQIRRLADESTAATEQVHQVLRDVEADIREAVRLSGAGMERADSGLSLARTYGDDLRKLTSIAEDNAITARQISAAVDQQTAGIGMIFEAITELGTSMGETVEAMRVTAAITARAEKAAADVAGAMSGWSGGTDGVDRAGGAASEPATGPGRASAP